MQISQNGINLIKYLERLVQQVYLDVVGYPTVCWGHVVLSSEKEKYAGRTVSVDECKEVLRKDLLKYEGAVNRLIRVPLSQNQFDSLVSFCLNIGTGALQRSTLRMKLNRGEYYAAADEFPKWKWAGGKPILLKRRLMERDLFLR